MPLVLQPIDRVAEAQLAMRLACWAKTANGTTDAAVQYQSCCVSPTGQTLGRWTIPDALCSTYGPLPFTGNDGETIPCPPTVADYELFYIYDDDVHDIDPNTCVEVTLTAPTGLASPTQGPTSIDITWDPVPNAQQYIVRWSPAGQDNWTELPPTSATEAQITGLSDETSYDFQVQAVATGYVDSPWSATLTQSTTSLGTLAAPTGLSSPSQTLTSIDVTWNSVTHATSYTIEWSPAGQNNWTPELTANTNYTITGLTEDTSYDIRVKATAPDWTDSPWSSVLTQSTMAQVPTPTNLASPSQTDTTVNLTWDASAGAQTYVVRWSPAGQGNWTPVTGISTTSTPVTGLTANTSYDFEVKAQAPGMVDSDWTAALTQSTAAALAAPVLTSPSQTTTSVDLAWGTVTNADAYTVQWSPAGQNNWTSLPSTTATSATVDGLTASTSYDFRARATAQGWDDSDWSAVLTQATSDPPQLATPTSLANGTATETTMPLSWDAVTDADTYTVEWSPAGQNNWTPVTGISAVNTTVTGLTANTSYDFRVKAVASGHTDSDWSAVLTQSTAMAQLAAPTGMSSPSQTDTSVTVSWSAVTDADTYTLEWSPAGAGSWTPITGISATSHEVTGLTADTSYDFRVKAVASGMIDSDWSSVLTQSTAMQQLAAPTNTANGTPTSTTMPLSWDAVTGADTYTVDWSPAGQNNWTPITGVTTTSHDVTGLTADTSYDFRVKAVATGMADSPWSAVDTASTVLPQLAVPGGLDGTGGAAATTFTLQWNAVTNADNYVLRWSPAGANNWTDLAPTASTTDQVTGLTASTSYDFQVKATAASGYADSDWSATWNGSTTAPPQLATPANLRLDAKGAISMSLDWDPVQNVDMYEVRWSPSGQNDWTNDPTQSSNTGTTVFGLSESTAYDFQVKANAVPGYTDSGWSTTLTETTKA